METGTTDAALPAEGAAIDHLRKFFHFLFVQFFGSEDFGPDPVLTADEGLEILDFPARIDVFVSLLGIDRTDVEAFTASCAGIDLDQLFWRKIRKFHVFLFSPLKSNCCPAEPWTDEDQAWVQDDIFGKCQIVSWICFRRLPLSLNSVPGRDGR